MKVYRAQADEIIAFFRLVIITVFDGVSWFSCYGEQETFPTVGKVCMNHLFAR